MKKILKSSLLQATHLRVGVTDCPDPHWMMLSGLPSLSTVPTRVDTRAPRASGGQVRSALPLTMRGFGAWKQCRYPVLFNDSQRAKNHVKQGTVRRMAVAVLLYQTKGRPVGMLSGQGSWGGGILTSHIFKPWVSGVKIKLWTEDRTFFPQQKIRDTFAIRVQL